MAFVYVHVFPNNKLYIGVTERPPKKRWDSNGCGYRKQPVLWRAIQKYGWDNIQHIILVDNIPIEVAYECEQYLITKYNTTNIELGYNLSIGGKHSSGYHFNHTEEAKQKISAGNKGKKRSDEYRKRMSESRKGYNKGCVSPMKGKHHTKEAKEKIRQANLGKPKSEETIEKLRQAAIGKHKGKRKPMSEETKRKISEANKGKKHGGRWKKKIKVSIEIEVTNND